MCGKWEIFIDYNLLSSAISLEKNIFYFFSLLIICLFQIFIWKIKAFSFYYNKNLLQNLNFKRIFYFLKMSLLRSVLLPRKLQLTCLNIVKRQTSFVELSRRFSSLDVSENRQKFLIPNSDLSELKCRSYAKQVKGGKKGKGGKKSLGEITDDLVRQFD